MPSCLWCSRSFSPRQSGGKEQRYCSPGCRHDFERGARRWVMAAIEAGFLTAETLRHAPRATPALVPAAHADGDEADIGSSQLASQEAAGANS